MDDPICCIDTPICAEIEKNTSIANRRRCKKRALLLYLAIMTAFLVFLTGCSRHQITSSPSGARVYVNYNPPEHKPTPEEMLPRLFGTTTPHSTFFTPIWYQVRKTGYFDSDIVLVGKDKNSYHFILKKRPPSLSLEKLTSESNEAPQEAVNNPALVTEREHASIQVSSVWFPGVRRCLWVLAVGVGQYKDPHVPDLPFARKDTERIREWFVNLGAQGMTHDSVHVLFDEQGTRENLLSQIDWLRRKALPEDAVFVYFAGHGAPELAPDGTSIDAKYLVLYDTNPDQLYATGFPLDELTRRLDGVKAKTQVVILEACYTGPVGQEILKKTPTADLEIRPRSIQKLGEKGGRVILSASSGRQMAIGSEAIDGSLFTHYLLNAWGDGSERLLSEGFDEAKYQVRRASNDLGSYQEPSKYGDQNVDVVLKQK